MAKVTKCRKTENPKASKCRNDELAKSDARPNLAAFAILSFSSFCHVGHFVASAISSPSVFHIPDFRDFWFFKIFDILVFGIVTPSSPFLEAL